MNTDKLAAIIADPTIVAELQRCTSVNELVNRLNQAGVACTREEGLRFLRTWETVAADHEPMDMEELATVTGGNGGLVSFIRSLFGHDSARHGKPVPAAKPEVLMIETILAQMNQQ